MKFLLDTNAIIPAEPTAVDDVETATPVVAEMLGLLARGRHEVFVHPDSVREIGGDRRRERRELRLSLLTKYQTLPSPPVLPEALRVVLGRAAGTHDEVDRRLLASVLADAVDYLVTDDRGLHKKAARLGIGERVLAIGDAVAAVRALFESVGSVPPAVEKTYCYNLDLADPIFDSLRSEYVDFDGWMRKCRLEHR
ncbi:MAG: GNAT family N-acetyltransferase, partial [Candidatus Binatia bacterium]